MKVLILTGTVIGFLLGIALGLAGRIDWPSAFLRAAAAAATLGLMMRWWGGVWISGLRESNEQRHVAEALERQQAHPTSAPKK